MYQVKDAMITSVISIPPSATVEEAIRTLLASKISGAPVIDQQGKLVGIISQFQLLEVLYDPQIRTQRIEQFMTRKVLTLEESALLGTAANLFVLHRIHRIPVVRDGRVVGVISRSDLLKYFLETGEKIETFFDTLKNAASVAETMPLKPPATAKTTVPCQQPAASLPAPASMPAPPPGVPTCAE